MGRVRSVSVQPRGTKRTIGLVYFVGGETGPVKIGWTQQAIKERLKCIQNGSPVKLLVLATLEGPREKEKWFHRLLANWRLHGEWFERSEDVQWWIDSLNWQGPRLPARFVPFAFGGVVHRGTAEPLRFGA